MTVVRHGEWVVDDVSRRDHHQVREGVRENFEEGQGQILDQVVEVTGWSRDNARRRLTAAAKRPPGSGRSVAKRARRPSTPEVLRNTARSMLQKVWAASGGQRGKYLAAMAIQLDGLERHGELVVGRDRYSPEVREELLAMSAASIDRYLRPAKAKDHIKGKSTTKPSPLLRSSVKIRKATDEIESCASFEGDLVAHCGRALKGEFTRTLNLTVSTLAGPSRAPCVTMPTPTSWAG